MHAVGFEAAMRLAAAMNIVPGSRTWEIGCGVPRLAAAISALSRTTVLCTDLPEVVFLIDTVVDVLMMDRTVANNLALFEVLEPVAMEAYIEQTCPFGVGDSPSLVNFLPHLTEQLTEWLALHPLRVHGATLYYSSDNPRRSKRLPTTGPSTGGAAAGLLENDDKDDDEDDEDYTG